MPCFTTSLTCSAPCFSSSFSTRAPSSDALRGSSNATSARKDAACVATNTHVHHVAAARICAAQAGADSRQRLLS